MQNNLYFKFMQDNFPNSSRKNDEKLIVTYKRIQEANACIEIIEKYSQLSCVNSGIIYSNRFQRNLNKLLLYLPLNDEIGINIIMRTIIESLLKYCYSITIERDFEKTNKTSFRNIKDDLNKIKTLEYFANNLLDNLFSLYSSYSNDVHLKKMRITPDCEALQNIISGESYDVNKINSDLTRIIDIYNSFSIKYFELRESSLTVSERIRLNNRVSEKRKKRFLEQLMP